MVISTPGSAVQILPALGLRAQQRLDLLGGPPFLASHPNEFLHLSEAREREGNAIYVWLLGYTTPLYIWPCSQFEGRNQCIQLSILYLKLAVGLGLEVRIVKMMHPNEPILTPRRVASAGGMHGNAVRIIKI